MRRGAFPPFPFFFLPLHRFSFYEEMMEDPLSPFFSHKRREIVCFPSLLSPSSPWIPFLDGRYGSSPPSRWRTRLRLFCLFPTWHIRVFSLVNFSSPLFNFSPAAELQGCSFFPFFLFSGSRRGLDSPLFFSFCCFLSLFTGGRGGWMTLLLSPLPLGIMEGAALSSFLFFFSLLICFFFPSKKGRRCSLFFFFFFFSAALPSFFLFSVFLGPGYSLTSHPSFSLQGPDTHPPFSPFGSVQFLRSRASPGLLPFFFYASGRSARPFPPLFFPPPKLASPPSVQTSGRRFPPLLFWAAGSWWSGRPSPFPFLFFSPSPAFVGRARCTVSPFFLFPFCIGLYETAPHLFSSLEYLSDRRGPHLCSFFPFFPHAG